MEQEQTPKGFQLQVEILEKFTNIKASLNGFASRFREGGSQSELLKTVETLRNISSNIFNSSVGWASFAAELSIESIMLSIINSIGEPPNHALLQTAIGDIAALRACYDRLMVLNAFPQGTHQELLSEIKMQTRAVAEIIEKLQRILADTCELGRTIPGTPSDLLNLTNLSTSLNTIAESFIVQSSLVISAQSQQVLLHGWGRSSNPRQRKMAPSRTNLSVQLLTLNLFIGAPNPPIMKVYLIDEFQARAIYEAGRCRISEIRPAGEVCSHQEPGSNKGPEGKPYISVVMNSLENKGELGVYEGEVINLQISTQPTRQRVVPVTKQKYCFLITAQLSNNVEAWNLSAPIIIRTHVTQVCDSVASILLDNYFADIVRLPFEVKNSHATWSQLEVLVSRYLLENEGISLSVEHKAFLKAKLSLSQDLDRIPLENFFDKKLMDARFSFWEWIFKWVDLLQKDDHYFGKLVRSGYIEGFIGRQEAIQLLEQQGSRPGDFVIRCSESYTGSLSVIFVQQNINLETVVGMHLISLEKCKDAHVEFLVNIHKLQVNAGGAVRAKAFENVVSRTIPQGRGTTIAFPATPQYNARNKMSRAAGQHFNVIPYNIVIPAITI